MAIYKGGNTLLDVEIILTKAGIEEGMRVADLGCGTTGHFVFPAASIVGKNGTVYAVDIMKTSLESIKKRRKLENLENIQAVWSNIEVFNATEIESGSLDVAMLINTLYQSHKRVEILREAVRMLKRSATLIVVEWKKVNLPFGPPVEERVKKELLQAGAQRLGFKQGKDFFVGQYHYGLIFTKL